MVLPFKWAIWHFGRKSARSCYRHKPVAHLNTHMILFMRVIKINVISFTNKNGTGTFR